MTTKLGLLAQPLALHDRTQIRQRIGELVVDDDEVEIVGVRDFLARIGEAARDRLGIVGRTRAQAALEFGARRRQDEDADASVAAQPAAPLRSASLARICCAPCQSISSNTSRPCASSGSTAVREVPLRSPCTFAYS